MTALTPDDFAAYFEALWERGPFPWQERLLRRAIERGWPSALDLPTGSGKTSVLDIATFALALDAARPAAERRQPRRIALIVDRRVIVDQGYERARQICTKLASATDGVLERVAHALRSLHSGLGDDRPISCAILRGGMVRDHDWARAPDQPLLLVSTVDQVGSRLLFRGYGVSSSMAPIHAGLLGVDTLYLLDEVHLSRPFEETLGAVASYAAAKPTLRPPTVVRMSATLGRQAQDVFDLDEKDRSHGVLRQRLEASKPTTLAPPINAPAETAKSCSSIAQACLAEATKLLESDAHDVVALIANRVDTARSAASMAKDLLAKKRVDVVLITGRMRPLDRQDIQQDVLRRVGAGRKRTAGKKTLLVSTQTVEAGADFDFDALVTECASLDALRQRFGRLDRRGELAGNARGVVVVAKRSVAEGADDPIYGSALAKTWAFLNEAADDNGVVDFGVNAQRSLEVRTELLAPALSAPALLPAYLDQWAQTSPRPAVEPDIDVFLHGPQRSNPDVQIVWRADLDIENASEATIRKQLAACPPSALETLAVPISSVRSWLRDVRDRESGTERTPLEPISDIEGEQAPISADMNRGRRGTTRIAPVVIWSGDDTVCTEDESAIHPGCTVVVPSHYGGIRLNNWDPYCSEEVSDRGDEAQLLHRGRATLRCKPKLLEWCFHDPSNSPNLPFDKDREYDQDAEPYEVLDDWMHALDESALKPWAKYAVRALKQGWRLVSLSMDGEHGSKEWLAAVAKRRVPGDILREIAAYEDGEIAWTEQDLGSFTGAEVTLVDHLHDVGATASHLASGVGLAASLVEDLRIAGELHDLGKGDIRFQRLLRGGNEIETALASEPIAKSALPAQDRGAYERARDAAGYPVGQRHELLSMALATSSESLRQRAHDWDLVLHLIASHHGHCRPLAPVEHDEEPRAVEIEADGVSLRAQSDHGLARLDSGIASRYWRLIRTYGWHGLAFLEAILRLADHRVSEDLRREERT